MPALLDAALYVPTLPARLQPLLEDVRRFMALNLACRAAEGPEKSAMIAALRAQHDALMAAALVALPPADAVSEAEAEAAFVSGVMRAGHYRQTALGQPPLVDTAGSATLADFAPEPTSPARLRAALLEAFSPSAAVLAAIDARMETELAQLQLRRRIMAALDACYPLQPSADNRAAIDALFTAFYPGHPLRSGEVEIIRTATALFFCLPLSGATLHTRAPDDPDRQRIADFLHQLTHFEPRYSAHFPSFGSLTPERLPAPLLAQLREESGLSAATLAAALSTMVVILPQREIDKYIVHDVWGHGWQALLFRFEETYQRVATYQRLPRLDAVIAGDSLRALVEAQVARLGRGQGIDTAPWTRWLAAVTAERLHDSLSGLSAEVLADVVEYKHIAMWPERSALMPSSSFVKEHPVKLDLTLLDLPGYYERALKGFARLAHAPRARQALTAALCRSGEDPVATRQVLDALADCTGEWLARAHGEGIVAVPMGEVVGVNTFSRAALNYLALHAQFNHLYTQLRVQRGGVGFADQLVFSVAAFLEADWRRGFWHVDEFLLRFPALSARLQAALRPA